VNEDASASAFDHLHPAVQHHIVNSLGWRSLRALQEEAIAPILKGEHVLVTAPTAGGKTEAAFLPVLSRMLTEDWRGLSVLYLCPLRALLNNLHVRLSGYADLVGRRVGLWHGDVSGPQRSRLLADPPDVLLTTPESLESMLVSTRVDAASWLAGLRTVIIDEAHAFVADDRGWHLLAVLARVSHLAQRELQRVALSATIGNPDEVMEWLTTGCRAPRQIVSPSAPATPPPDITLDYVGSLENAALVISRVHRGEKRLAFVDSRARAEQLAAALRSRGTTTFVSHGSLGVDARRQAERAFAEARDCVIVATSTLELGIDVGDLDRVIQIDAPPSVASFLQRLGRSGRRAETTRNTTVLATDDDALLRAAAVLLRWSEGYIEPTQPPALPLHLVAQQLLALALQNGEIGRYTWPDWFGEPFVFGRDVLSRSPRVLNHLVAEGYLIDTGGMLSIGGTAERRLGRRHFMELLAVFSEPPLFSVRHGRLEIGLVPDEALLVRPPGNVSGPAALLLGGRSWRVRDVDWRRRVIQVEPTEAPGVARWSGGRSAMSNSVTRAVREVLTGATPIRAVESKRAGERLAYVRGEMDFARPDATTVVVEADGRSRWWTFAGRRANTWLAAMVTELRRDVAAIDDLAIALDRGVDGRAVTAAVASIDVADVALAQWMSEEAIRGLKFFECLPSDLAQLVIDRRLRADETVRRAIAEPLVTHRRASRS
jgi:ATP-dependent Lhr-like helicase